MSKGFDLTNRRFGFLTAICKTENYVINKESSNPSKTKKTYLWKCKCICGREILYRPNKVLQGRRISCGCYKKFSIDNETLDSFPEASYFLLLKKNGVSFECHKNYPNSRMKCDFYLPDTDEYIEITSFDKSSRIWPKYSQKIEIKRQLAEKHGSKFTFIIKPLLTKEEMAEVTSVMLPRAVIEKHKPIYDSYKSIDWSLSDDEIVKIKGSTKNNVIAMRKYYHPELVKRINWDAVDWNLSNENIAQSLGRKINTVRNRRSKLKRFNLKSY